MRSDHGTGLYERDGGIGFEGGILNPSGVQRRDNTQLRSITTGYGGTRFPTLILRRFPPSRPAYSTRCSRWALLVVRHAQVDDEFGAELTFMLYNPIIQF